MTILNLCKNSTSIVLLTVLTAACFAQNRGAKKDNRLAVTSFQYLDWERAKMTATLEETHGGDGEVGTYDPKWIITSSTTKKEMRVEELKYITPKGSKFYTKVHDEFHDKNNNNKFDWISVQLSHKRSDGYEPKNNDIIDFVNWKGQGMHAEILEVNAKRGQNKFYIRELKHGETTE